MKKKVLFIGGFLLLWAIQMHAQNAFWERVTVRKAYESKTADDSKPAIFSYTNPKEKEESWLLNGGVGFDLFQWHWNKNKSDQQMLSAFAVYNRNTLLAKKQNNYKVGVSMSNRFDNSSAAAVKGIFGNSTFQYLHNYVDTSHSLIVTSYWHPFYKSGNNLFIGGYGSTNSILSYYILPQAGAEYQQIIEANSKAKKGYDARLFYNISLHIMIKKKTRQTTDQVREDVTDSLLSNPIWSQKTLAEAKQLVDSLVPNNTTRVLPKQFWEKLLEFSISYTGRSSFLRYHSNFEKYLPLFTVGANLFPLKTENFSFGISYNAGANPIDGTLKQTFWLFSLTFKK